MILTAIIVDDEEYGRRNLSGLISKYCSSIHVTNTAHNISRAIDLIESVSPDILFLDIKMPKGNGFDLLKKIGEKQKLPIVVFVTAYSEYAIDAIRIGTTDYLMKPVDVDELVACEKRILKLLQDSHRPAEISHNRAINVPHSKGIRSIHFDEIIYLEAENSYTIFYLVTNDVHEKFVISKNLGDIEELLPSDLFYRIHKSYIINVTKMKEYISDDNYVKMQDGSHVEVSRRRISDFRHFLKGHTAKNK